MSGWGERALVPVLVSVGAYAVGCVVGAYYLVRLRTGQDLRALGSGNAGATNAGHVLGKRAYAVSLLVDAGKGSLVAVSARALSASPAVVASAMVAVVAGHVWPAQLGFRGGKGAATALGLLIVYDLRVAVTLLACGLLILALTRRFEESGFAALGLAPVVALAFGKEWTSVTGLVLVVAIVYWAHFARRVQ